MSVKANVNNPGAVVSMQGSVVDARIVTAASRRHRKKCAVFPARCRAASGVRCEDIVNQNDDTMMQSQSHNFRKTALRSALALALAITSWLPGAARAADQEGTPKSSPMRQITTQAQAEALKPGDSIAMVCAMCKIVNVEQVTADQTHVKTLTVGEKLACPTCGATVEVVATGTGEGRNAEVNYVCSECGDQAMFVTATESGSGSHAKRGE